MINWAMISTTRGLLPRLSLRWSLQYWRYLRFTQTRLGLTSTRLPLLPAIVRAPVEARLNVGQIPRWMLSVSRIQTCLFDLTECRR